MYLNVILVVTCKYNRNKYSLLFLLTKIERNYQFKANVSAHVKYAYFAIQGIIRQIFKPAHIIYVSCIEQVCTGEIQFAESTAVAFKIATDACIK